MKTWLLRLQTLKTVAFTSAPRPPLPETRLGLKEDSSRLLHRNTAIGCRSIGQYGNVF